MLPSEPSLHLHWHEVETGRWKKGEIEKELKPVTADSDIAPNTEYAYDGKEKRKDSLAVQKIYWGHHIPGLVSTATLKCLSKLFRSLN